MASKNDKGWYDKFAEAFHDVVVPTIEDLEKRLKDELASKDDIDKLEIKIDKVINRLDRHDTKLDNHEKRIQTLEASPL